MLGIIRLVNVISTTGPFWRLNIFLIRCRCLGGRLIWRRLLERGIVWRLIVLLAVLHLKLVICDQLGVCSIQIVECRYVTFLVGLIQPILCGLESFLSILFLVHQLLCFLSRRRMR